MVHVLDKQVNMSGKTIYGEPKNKTTLTLTKTALKWLEKMQIELNANSLSDAIEKMSRNQ
jgi:hypothetical protein